MPSNDLSPAHIIARIKKGNLLPFYLFYGENLFLLEKTLGKIKNELIPEEFRDLNQHIFYGDELRADFSSIIDAARSLPFIAEKRLVIVRRTEKLSSSALDNIIPYIDKPVKSTCLIFVTSKPDFRKKFYARFKKNNRTINFKELYDNQVAPWISKTAGEIGFKISAEAGLFLQQVVGNKLTDLASELEKIFIRYGNSSVGLDEVKDFVSCSRSYNVFELMDEISMKRRGRAILILNSFLAAEGNEGALRVFGMLIRQIRLLWQARAVVKQGGRMEKMAQRLKVHPFLAKKIIQQSKAWTAQDLENAFQELYQADKLIKSGSQGQVVIENIIMNTIS
jgi:DNA polymerase-3 subunit delta